MNQLMENECLSSAARYGIALNAALITGIDPPHFDRGEIMNEFYLWIAPVVVALFGLEALLLGLLRGFGVFTVVQERQAKIFVLLGNVLGVIDQPGLHFLWANMLANRHRMSLAVRKELAEALFAILETEQIIGSKAQITLIPAWPRRIT